MDSIYAIAFGLGLRTLVDAVSQDFRLTGSLIGLWEGVITLHFLKKMPKSSDPYIAFGVRLFIDFLVTESVERLVLVLIWTAFGMVLADVAPAIWDEVGLKRVWRHFRRDLYTIYEKIPKVAFFPPPRTVRFSPSREPSIINPSIATSQDTPIAIIPPSSSAPTEPLKRRVPGYYPGDYSDTDTDRGSIIRSRPSPQTEVNDALGTTHYRLSTMPRLNPTYSVSDLDEANQSSAGSSSDSIEMGDPSSINQEDIPDMEGAGEEQVLVDIKEADPTTPKQKPMYIPMPPTPSDSAARWDIQRDIVDDVLHGRPRPEVLSDIPDSVEDGAILDGWEKIQRRELDEDRPPTPPAKDEPVGGLNDPISVSIPLPVPPMVMRMNMNASTNPLDIDFSLLDSFPDPQVPTSTTTGLRRESGPPPYTDHRDEYDEIYCNSPLSRDNKLLTTTADDVNVNENVKNNNDNNDDNNDFAKLSSGQTGDPDINSTHQWASGVSTSFDATAQAQADALKEEARLTTERLRKEKEEDRVRKEEEERVEKEEERARKEEERVRKEEEERVRKEEERVQEEEERVRKEEERTQKEEERTQKEAEKAREADKKKKAEERTERLKKEAEDDALRKKRQEEAAAEEKNRHEDAAKKKKEEEATRKKKEKEEAAEKKREEEVTKRKKEEEAASKKKEEKEATKKKKEKEEAAKKKKEEEAASKKEEEEAASKKKEEEAAKKKKEEEAEQKRKDDEAETKRRDEEEAKQKEEEKKEAKEAVSSMAEAGAQEKSKTEAKETDRISAETEAQRAKLDNAKAEAVEDQAAQEDEDDSKTVHNVETLPDTTTPPPRGDFTEEESVMSEATVNPPEQAKERLERMMTLRAQMVELENLLDQRKKEGCDEQDPEVKAVEKALRKFRRQAERRYAAGMSFFKFFMCIMVNKSRAGAPLARHLNGDGDGISLDKVPPQIVGRKMEEKLEQLLTPTSRSITFNLTFQKGRDAAAKQKPVVLEIMHTFVSVFSFCISIINIRL